MPLNHTDGTSDLDQATAVFLGTRQRLFGIAYRMLGSAAEAEDIVQETWIRWQTTDRAVVLEPMAFLTTITVRLALNVAQSARSRRETYIGPWLPEPVDTRSDPQLGTERGEALSLAMLTLLEKLSPVERAAYVLREAFDYPYQDIAKILELSDANTRQIVYRARKHLSGEGRASSTPATFEQQSTLLQTFIGAAQRGDLAELESLFASEVVSRTDGNGIVNAARIPVAGRSRVAKFIGSFATHFWAGVSVAYIQANGKPAVLISRDGSVVAFATIEVSGEDIGQIFWVMSPAKLASISLSWPELQKDNSSAS
jgi:RNA polymerase sigma-70 factor (ECF subfamily)